MNYLLHVYFCDRAPGCLAGAIAGDFVKGLIENTEYSAEIKKGLILHRKLDRFAQDNPFYQKSRDRLGPEYRRISGITLDILYDHFLAKNWSDYSEQALGQFVQEIYSLLELFQSQLPAEFGRFFTWMVKENWLQAYRELGWIEQVLKRMSRRIRFKNNLSQSFWAIQEHYDELYFDFQDFMQSASQNLPCNKGQIYYSNAFT